MLLAHVCVFMECLCARSCGAHCCSWLRYRQTRAPLPETRALPVHAFNRGIVLEVSTPAGRPYFPNAGVLAIVRRYSHLSGAIAARPEPSSNPRAAHLQARTAGEALARGIFEISCQASCRINHATLSLEPAGLPVQRPCGQPENQQNQHSRGFKLSPRKEPSPYSWLYDVYCCVVLLLPEQCVVNRGTSRFETESSH